MKPPAILTPRNGLVLPDSLVFQWRGSRSSLVTLRIVGPDRLVFERANLVGMRFEYPKNAPPLLAGVRYRFQLLSASSPPQEVWFELVKPSDAQTIRRELHDLDEALAGAPPPPSTLAELRAGVLASHGLLHDAVWASPRRSSATRTSPPSISCSASFACGRGCRRRRRSHSRRRGCS